MLRETIAAGAHTDAVASCGPQGQCARPFWSRSREMMLASTATRVTTRCIFDVHRIVLGRWIWTHAHWAPTDRLHRLQMLNAVDWREPEDSRRSILSRRPRTCARRPQGVIFGAKCVGSAVAILRAIRGGPRRSQPWPFQDDGLTRGHPVYASPRAIAGKMSYSTASTPFDCARACRGRPPTSAR